MDFAINSQFSDTEINIEAISSAGKTFLIQFFGDGDKDGWFIDNPDATAVLFEVKPAR